ncbi:hypothetical protein BKA70DRAFT_669179 [Coprinopsis sp. MPI-PUGE-AT-0042]|nr:hypothetical protein BKA70DRAFT_669179 [Coprinopsis sp. MPI-PUGE-AT-0042]
MSSSTDSHPLPSEAPHLSNLHNAIFSAEGWVQALEQQLNDAKTLRDALVLGKGSSISPSGASHLPVKIVANIVRHTLAVAKEAQDPNRPCETDPFQMMDLRLVCKTWNGAALENPDLWRGVQLDLDRWDPTTSWIPGTDGKRYALWNFVRGWTKRAGKNCQELRLVLRGVRERNVQNGPFANVTVRKELAAILSGRHIQWTEWHIESPLLPSLTIRRQLIQGGIIGLIMQHMLLFDGDEGYGPADGRTALNRLTRISFWDNWTPYEVLRRSDQYKDLINLESLFVSQVRMPVPIILDFTAHIPSTLRFLHIHGNWGYQLGTILGISKLEELILDSSTGPCGLTLSAAGPVTNSSLRRLIIIGPEPLAVLPSIFQNAELPSLTLIRLCSVGYERGRHWDQNAGQAIIPFYARSRLSSVDLSMEHVGTRDWELFENVLHIFRHVKIGHLFLEDVDTVLRRTSMEDQEVNAIICRTTPTGGYRMLSSGSDVKRCMYLPRTQVEPPSPFKHAFDIQFLLPQDMDRMFDHGIRGHQSLKSLDHLLRLSASYLY